MRKLVLALLGLSMVVALEASPFKLNAKNAFLDTIMFRHRAPPPPPTKSTKRIITEGNMPQRIDHFDADNIEFFDQRFLSNYEHYNVNVGGPLFILVGGEWPISNEWLEGGHMFDLAEEHGGAMFYVEHRFYGSSFPRNRTANLDTLQYMTAEQALYDVAYFIEQIRYLLPHFNDAEVILVGASFGGSLVTWYQKTYYDLIDGGWASSAPVLAIEDFTEAIEVAGAVLRDVGGEVCHENVREAFEELTDLFAAQNYNQIRSTLNVCDGVRIETDRGMWTLNEILATEFIIMAALSSDEIYDLACTEINNGATPLQGLAAFNSLIFDDECIEFDYETAIELLSEDEWIDEWNLEFRLVLWQLCSETGWFFSSTSPNQPFGNNFPIDLFHMICDDLFDITPQELAQNVAATNERFNGLNPTVENLITTQGRHDPFRPAGVQEDLTESATVRIIEDGGHMSDFFSYDGTDSDDVRAAKNEIAEKIRGWLANGRRSKA